MKVRKGLEEAILCITQDTVPAHDGDSSSTLSREGSSCSSSFGLWLFREFDNIILEIITALATSTDFEIIKFLFHFIQNMF